MTASTMSIAFLLIWMATSPFSHLDKDLANFLEIAVSAADTSRASDDLGGRRVARFLESEFNRSLASQTRSMTQQIDQGNQETELRVQQSASAIEGIGDAVAASMSEISRDR